MKNDKPAGRNAGGKPKEPPAAAAGFVLRAPTDRPIVVRHLEVPAPRETRRRIHPRRTLRRVKEGKERAFHSVTAPVMFHPARSLAAAIRAATDEVALVTNTPLVHPSEQRLASSVGEPSTAINGRVVMYTGNWYSARSVDAGQTFQFIDPFTSFPDPPNLAFCCDQVVNYIAAIDTFVWLLQYGVNDGPEVDNIQRLAFAKTADVEAGRWKLLDITTASLGAAGEFMDFPDLAVGDNFLYVTTNLFNAAGRSTGAAVIRIRFDSLGAAQPTAQHFVSRELDSFRVAQNTGPTAFFAAHADTSTLRVFAWPEAQAAPNPTDVGVSRWIGGAGYQSRTPDGGRWLDRIDPRITGAARASDELWFAWSVDKNSNHRPQPFVQIARIDATNLTLLENINIFDPDSAIAYGGLSSNAAGEVGISYVIGGGTRFPSHMVGILTGTRRDVQVNAGARAPLDGQWGDYLAVRPVYSGPPNNQRTNLFSASGYTMNGAGDGSNRDATPRFVVFGRAGDVTAVAPTPQPGEPAPAPVTPAPTPPVTPAPLPPTPAGDGGPISDVNTLPVVSAAAAVQIKRAAGLTPDVLAARPRAVERAVQALQAGEEADKPGKERWPVKTGQDKDRAKVGKNVIAGQDLGAGIVETTIEEMVLLPRPPGLENVFSDPPQFVDIRDGVTEITIWRLEAVIIALKHESDGDYHLVLQGDSGSTIVGEIPTPTKKFVGDSPWLANIKDARQEIDDRLVKKLNLADFTMAGGILVPRSAMVYQPYVPPSASMMLNTPAEGSGMHQALFATQITPTRLRITGVGFFDRSHGATGAAPNVFELHPVLKVEWV